MTIEAGSHLEPHHIVNLIYEFPHGSDNITTKTMKIPIGPFSRCLSNIAAKDKIEMEFHSENTIRIRVISSATNVHNIQSTQYTEITNYIKKENPSQSHYYPSIAVPLSGNSNISKMKSSKNNNESTVQFYGCDKYLLFKSENVQFRVGDEMLSHGDFFTIENEGTDSAQAKEVEKMYHRQIPVKFLRAIAPVSSIGGTNARMHFCVPKIDELPLVCVLYIPTEGAINSSVQLFFGQ